MERDEVLTLLVKVIGAADDYEWGAASAITNHIGGGLTEVEQQLVDEAVSRVMAS